MMKHFMMMVVVSMVIIFFEGWSWLQEGCVYVVTLYHRLEAVLHRILPGGPMIHRAESLVLMILIPLLFSGAVATVYYMVKKRFMSEFMTVAWLFWLLLVMMLSVTKMSLGY